MMRYADTCYKQMLIKYFTAVCSTLQDDEAVALPPRPKPLNNITSALILSLSVCYRARLHERAPYEDQISRFFNPPLVLPGGDQRFNDEIKWYLYV